MEYSLSSVQQPPHTILLMLFITNPVKNDQLTPVGNICDQDFEMPMISAITVIFKCFPPTSWQWDKTWWKGM